MSDDLLVARQLLAVLEKRINIVKQRRPEWVPSQRELYILKLPTLVAPFEDNEALSLGNETPVTTRAQLGSDAAFVVQKILLVAAAGLWADGSGGTVAAGVPFFDIIDRASGGRSLIESQQGNTPNNRLPLTHFANALPGNTRGATYSFFTLPSEYLLPRGAVVEARMFRALSQECAATIALAGYKVYG